MDFDWMARGRCREMDPAVFFPSESIGVRRAQDICATCSVQDPCLRYALAERIDDGVWGGTSERQRKRLRRQVCAAKPPVAPHAGHLSRG